MGHQFNNELLLLARQYRDRSQSEVAAQAGIDQGHYSKVERGILGTQPSDETISSIAGALEFPVNFFYQPDELSGLPLSVHQPAYRKRASLPATELKRLQAELNLRLMHLRRYLTAVEVEAELELPKLDVDEMGGASKIARYLRQAWMVPEGPIKNLTKLCERAGILVIHCNFHAKVDGVTMRLRDLPPVIFLNSNAPADRMRFSLAHELCHLIAHSLPSDTMETEADEFAGEFLTPPNELRSDLIGGRVTLARLAQLKQYRQVSMNSLLYQASKHGIITKGQAGYMWRQMAKRGWRQHEPDETEFPKEKTRLYDQIIHLHENDLGYQLQDFAAMLCMNINDVQTLYPVNVSEQASHLRIIK